MPTFLLYLKSELENVSKIEVPEGGRFCIDVSDSSSNSSSWYCCACTAATMCTAFEAAAGQPLSDNASDAMVCRSRRVQGQRAESGCMYHQLMSMICPAAKAKQTL